VHVAQQRTGEFEEIRIGGALADGQTESGQLEIDVSDQFPVAIIRDVLLV
jgi:hypothetical protein